MDPTLLHRGGDGKTGMGRWLAGGSRGVGSSLAGDGGEGENGDGQGAGGSGIVEDVERGFEVPSAV